MTGFSRTENGATDAMKDKLLALHDVLLYGIYRSRKATHNL
jgi:hypothetical protein